MVAREVPVAAARCSGHGGRSLLSYSSLPPPRGGGGTGVCRLSSGLSNKPVYCTNRRAA